MFFSSFQIIIKKQKLSSSLMTDRGRDKWLRPKLGREAYSLESLTKYFTIFIFNKFKNIV